WRNTSDWRWTSPFAPRSGARANATRKIRRFRSRRTPPGNNAKPRPISANWPLAGLMSRTAACWSERHRFPERGDPRGRPGSGRPDGIFRGWHFATHGREQSGTQPIVHHAVDRQMHTVAVSVIVHAVELGEIVIPALARSHHHALPRHDEPDLGIGRHG